MTRAKKKRVGPKRPPFSIERDDERDDEDEIDEAREELGKIVRVAWIGWAKTQDEPKLSWLLPWDEMEEEDREADRVIGEAVAAHVRKERQREIASARAEIHQRAEAHNRDINRANRETSRAVAAEWKLGIWRVGLICVVLGLSGSLGYTLAAIPEPVVCPPPVECPTCVAEPAPVVVPNAPTEANGYVIEGEFGTRIVVPWPDTSNYPADLFESDCSAVCSVPGIWSDPEPGRVLMVDPAHLICVCFHAMSSFPVQRWINWERVP